MEETGMYQQSVGLLQELSIVMRYRCVIKALVASNAICLTSQQ